MKSLTEYDRTELEAELRRRDQETLNSLKPKAKTAFNPDPLIEMCEQYVHEIWSIGFTDEDLQYYIFETAMTCVFGEKIFERINQHRRSK